MEVMALPNRETVMFHSKVRPWIIGGEKKNGVMYYEFSSDTPINVLQLFDKLKSKLSYQAARV